MQKKTKLFILKTAFAACAVAVCLEGFSIYTEHKTSLEENKYYSGLSSQVTSSRQESSSAANSSSGYTLPAVTSEIEPPYQSPVDFASLEAVNPETVGWLKIPQTDIDYPVLQTSDNDKYLACSFDLKKSSSGSIFLDYESDSSFNGKNNIIYGHNMKAGTMFAQITKFNNIDFFNSHRDLYIYTPQREIHLKTIGVTAAPAQAWRRQTKFGTEDEFHKYVSDILNNCTISDSDGEDVDSLFSFITCSYEGDDYRTYLYAKEVKN